MPVYNAAEYLEEALASLLIQTFTDFEVLAINDGSTDDSLEILNKFAQFDSRIRVISQSNTGIVKVLNRGISEAKANYIARMDSDDVSFPNRFKDQVSILDKSPGVVLVAGDFEVIDQEGEFLYRELVAPRYEDIKRALFLRNPIAHGSVMFRKDVVQKIGGYSDAYGPTEDLELWMRLSNEGDFAATASPTYKWRMNQGGITLTKNKESIAQSSAHIERLWRNQLPKQLNRQQVMKTANYYLKTYKKHGVYYKYSFLADTSQLAAKFFTHGHPLAGLRQLFVVASTGRVGLKIALKRVHLVNQGRYSQIRRFTQLGRRSLD